MDLEQMLVLGGGAAFLGLAAVCAARARRSTLAMPTALLCVDMFAYNTLELLGSLTAEPHWEWLESAAAALAAPLLYHLILAFLGARRRWRLLLVASYVYFGAVAASSVSPFVAPQLREYPGGDVWASVMLAGVLLTFLHAAWNLVAHYRHSGSVEERARTQLFIGTVIIGVGGPATDLAAIAGASSAPRLAAPGLLVSAALLTAIAVRVRLLRGALSMLAVNAVLIGVVGVVAQVLLFQLVGTEIAMLVLGTVVVTLVLLGAARTTWGEVVEHRERTTHLATLGRLSAQMAHDIRNPLAAIHGAAQYLDEERRRGGSLEDNGEFLGLILEQTERLERVVQDYRRLGRAEAVLEEVDIVSLIEAVIAGASVGVGAEGDETIEVCSDVQVDRPANLDRELLSTALENLVRNAIEAIRGAQRNGRVEVRAHLEEGRSGATLVLAVEDDGPGMDARTREQSEEAFFTTKAQGSGLGLAFVRRVAEAHRGRMRVDTALGRGTTIWVRLPLDGSRVSAPHVSAPGRPPR